MSFKNQSVFSSVFTNTTFTITEEMQISEVSIEVVSGTATLLGGLQIPGLVNIPVSLDFNQPVVLKANKGYTLSDITVDSTAGGVFEIIGIYGYNDGVDPAAAAYFAATGITGATQQAAIDGLVKSLKGYGLWSKMKAIYPFVTDQRNLAGYSEDITNAIGWNSVVMTRTANTAIAPNGTLTADTFATTSNANNVFWNLGWIAGNGQTFTNSIYLKYNNAQWVTLEIWNGTGQDGIRLWVDVQNGVLGTANATVGTYLTSSISNEGNGWYRVSVTGIMPGTNNALIALRHADGNGVYNFTAVTGKSTFCWGAQNEIGTLTAYQPQLASAQSAIANQFKYNLKDPRDLDAAFRLVFNGGWTFSTNGALPNGTNGFADTFFNPRTNLSQFSVHASNYSRTQNTSVNGVQLGAYDSVSNSEVNIWQYYASVLAKGSSLYGYSLTAVYVNNTNTLGFQIGNRTANNSAKLYFNGSSLNTNTNTETKLLPNRTIYLGGSNWSTGPTQYTPHQHAFDTIGEGLTDTEAANLYIAVQTYQEALSRQVGLPVVSDPNAQAFIDAAQITDVTQADAINNLVLGLKYNGLWTKMKAVYPFVGGTASTHKFNLMNPVDSDAAYRLVFNGGWTHSSNGATPNGTNGYANTYLSPSSSLSTTSGHFSFYSRTNNNTGVYDMGSSVGATEQNLITRYLDDKFYTCYGATAQVKSIANTSSLGLFVTNRNSSTNTTGYKNGVKVIDGAQTSALSTVSLYISALNLTGSPSSYSNRQTAFASIGDGLTDADALNLYTIVQAYQTALGRQIA